MSVSSRASPLSPLEYIGLATITVATVALYEYNYFNYLLFHSTVEIFSAIIFLIAAFVALISWRRIRNSYLLLIGVAFAFIPGVDLIHTLAYRGMDIFTSDANIPTSLWILARYMQAAAFLAAPLLHKRSWDIRIAVAAFGAVTVIGVASILMGFFPVTYVEGFGLTPFKIYSEYVISAILIASLLFLHKIQGEFQPKIYGLLAGSIILSVFSELAFTNYVGVYDFANLVGHIFKLVVAYMLFKALVKDGIEDPFNTIFHDYEVAQKRLLAQSEELRIKSDKLDKLNEELAASNEELRVSEESLASYASDLEEKVEERTREVRVTEEKLRQNYTAAAVGRMGATIAHDLRTPLNVISQAAEGLEKFPESRPRLVQMIRSNSARALAMIDDIRNATRDIEVKPGSTDRTALAKNAVTDANLSPGIISYVETGEGLESVVIDQNLIRRVLDNLIRNSVEAMPDGGRLGVVLRRNGDLISISVSDTGVGISNEVADKMFEPFFTTKPNGTGLGLPFCRRAVEAHGGNLTFESTSELGTVFTATLREKKG